MFDRLLPPVIDNTYRGPKAALWILGFLAASKVTMSLNSIFNGSYVLSSADGVPLASYPAAASQTILAFFAIWALWQLLFSLLAVLALARYRSMTPLMFALLLVEHLSRKLVLQFVPIVRSHASPASLINAALLGLTAAGLLLSLWRRREPGATGLPPNQSESEGRAGGSEAVSGDQAREESRSVLR